MKKRAPVFPYSICIFVLSLSVNLFASCCTRLQPGLASPRNNDQDKPFTIGDTCTYTHFKGRALLLKVAWINKHKVEVTFTFTPSDPAQTAEYRFPYMGDISRKKTMFVEAAKYDSVHSLLQAGDVIPCIRSEIIKGTCSPVVFTFPDLEP